MGNARPLRCASSPQRTRFAGLHLGPHPPVLGRLRGMGVGKGGGAEAPLPDWPLATFGQSKVARRRQQKIHRAYKLRGCLFYLPPVSRCLSKTHFFFSGRKRMVFEIQRKRGLMALLKRWQKRYGGVRLYAHGVDWPRPLRPAPVEQGKAVVLSLRRLAGGPCGA